MKNFKELKVWKKGIEIAMNSYKITATFPAFEKYGLASQITRAAVSIASNIAEGSSKGGTKDYKRFLEISLGSCFELETQLLISRELNYGDQSLISITLDLLQEEEKMLTAFCITLSKIIHAKLTANG